MKKILLVTSFLTILIIGGYIYWDKTLGLSTIPLISNKYFCKKSVPEEKDFLIKNFVPNYNVSKTEEEEFYSIIKNTFDQTKFESYRRILQETKSISPQAYFIIEKHNLRLPEYTKDTFNFWLLGDQRSIAETSHEYSHTAKYPCFSEKYKCIKNEDSTLTHQYGLFSLSFIDEGIVHKKYYWIEDKLIPIYLNLRSLYRVKYIKQKPNNGSLLDTRIDSSYSEADIGILVDEINTYTLASKVIRSAECSNLPKSNVNSLFYSSVNSRLIYLASLYLQDAKNNRRHVWDDLKQNKEFAYLMRFITEKAKEEIDYTKQEFSKNKVNTIRDVNTSEQINQNLLLSEPILQDFYIEAGIEKIPVKNMSLEYLERNTINFELIFL